MLLTKALNARHGTQGWYFSLAHPRIWVQFSAVKNTSLLHAPASGLIYRCWGRKTVSTENHHWGHSNMSWVTWISMFGFLFSPSQRVVPSHLPVCWYLPLLILLTLFWATSGLQPPLFLCLGPCSLAVGSVVPLSLCPSVFAQTRGCPSVPLQEESLVITSWVVISLQGESTQ